VKIPNNKFQTSNNIQIPNFKELSPVLLVSGGPDSIYLFHCFLKLKREQDTDFKVLHFNHHLRGEESDAEEKFVVDLCANHGIRCYVRHIKGLSKKIQEQARQKRFEHLYQLQKEEAHSIFVTAHHADDFLETVIMKAGRGAGLKGLTGIRTKQVFPNPYLKNRNIEIHRPLLSISKTEIIESLDSSQIAFCTDSSNQNLNYLRNRVRHDILKNWTDKNKKKQVKLLAHDLQGIDDYFEARLNFLQKQYEWFVPVDVWNTWPKELQFRFFSSKMVANGFSQQIEQKHFSQTEKEESKLVLDETLFLKDSSGCYFVKQSLFKEYHLEEVLAQTEQYFPGFNLTLSLKETRFPLKGQRKTDLFLSKSKLRFPLFLSRVKMSEPFTPFGHKSERSIKRLFNAHGIPKYQRLFWPVLCDKHGDIIAVLGLEISEQYRVDEGEDRAILVQSVVFK